MARFVLEFDTDNAAFQDGKMKYQIGRILRRTAERIANGGIDFDDPRPVRDVNGNTIGQFVLNREQSADTTGQSGRYRCTCGYGPTTEGDRDTHVLEMSKVNDTVEHRPVR